MSETKNSTKEKSYVMIAVLQGQDAPMAIEALTDEGFGVTRLPSVGGFLGRKSASLMIGINEKDEERVLELLNQTSRKRVAFIAVPMENSPLPMPAPTPVTIGGANIFSLEVDHYEEF